MLLSEAILKGCEGTEQNRLRFLSPNGSCCAIGAAMIGSGICKDTTDIGNFNKEKLMERFPVLKKIHIWPSGQTGNDIWTHISGGLNMVMSREDIAKWVAETFEKPQARLTEPEVREEKVLELVKV